MKQIRWMIRRDMPRVLEIENACFEFPWDEGDFICYLRKRTAIGMVVEDERSERVVAFLIYEFHKTWLHVVNMAVDPAYQRQGIGRQIAAKIHDKLGPRRNRAAIKVRESNLDAHLFLRACDFIATEIHRQPFEDSNEDAYLFELYYPSRLFTEPLPAKVHQ